MLSIIAAFDENRLIGDSGRLPWNIPGDLKKFKELTSGNVVIMGRKTFESIGRPLPNRINIVLTRRSEYTAEGVLVFNDLELAIEKASEYKKEIFIIGGAEIYRQALEISQKLYISHIKGVYKGDAYFPEINWRKWKVAKREIYESWEFVEYTKI